MVCGLGVDGDFHELVRQCSVLPLSLDHGLESLTARLGDDDFDAVISFEALQEQVCYAK